MVQIRLYGPQTSSDLGQVSVINNGVTGNAIVSAFRAPVAIADLPRINDGFDTDTLTTDITGLTVTSSIWRELGGATLGTSATLSGAGHGGKWVEYSHDGGSTWSPPIMIYASAMMGMAMSASHIVDDRLILSIVPHNDITHLAVADGDWTKPNTWLGGRVPKSGARFLIPRGITVTYDSNDRFRLDWGRVDGSLIWAIDRSTQMLIETLVVTRGGRMDNGTVSSRLPAQYTMDVTISGWAYRQNSYTPTDLDISRDAGLWGRGIISQGTWNLGDAEKRPHAKCDPIDADATSLTLHQEPTGWVVGDTIVISGTKADYNRDANPMIVQDETRVISAINGRVISWVIPLAYPHKNQLAESNRTDLYPVVMLKQGRNITIQSEVSNPVWQRGHVAFVHHHASTKHYGGQFVRLGRTDKSQPVGRIDENGDFLFQDGVTTLTTNSADQGTEVEGFFKEPPTAQSNISGRYAWHLHHPSNNPAADARPKAQGVYAEDTMGWLFVHHTGTADFVNCAAYNFWGSGFVAESGPELGDWHNNLALYSPASDPNGTLEFNPKNTEGPDGICGNNFKRGNGFSYRGRGVSMTDNIAASCPWGHVFYHRGRGINDPMIFRPVDPLRNNIDIGDVGRINANSAQSANIFSFLNNPILHFEGNEAIGCLGSLHITKQGPQQSHDKNVKLSWFTAWGFYESGADIEYVAPYVLSHFDIISGGTGGDYGIRFNPNTANMALVNCRVEGCDVGLLHDGSATTFNAALFDNVNDPRWIHYGNQIINCTTDLEYKNVSSKAGPLVTLVNDDWAGTAIDYDLDPTDTLPLVLGEWDGSGNTVINAVDNTSGKKVTNIGAGMNIMPKLWNDFVFNTDGFKVRLYSQNHKGYWTADIGNGPEEVVVLQDVISDPVTARPCRRLKMFQTTSTPTSSVNNGTFNYSARPVTQGNKLVAVPLNGSITIDVVSGATGGDGNTYALVEGMYVAPNHGLVSLNFATGVVTYTPRPGFEGTDSMTVFVESGGQSATVRIDTLVGAGGNLATPVAGTYFTASDATETNTIDVALFDSPATGGRRITLVQYSTDGGASWRRLTHGWAKSIYKVTVESDGTAITPGSYNLRIRYKTDYDLQRSTASSDIALTVS